MSGRDWLPSPVTNLLRNYRRARRARVQQTALSRPPVDGLRRIIIGSSGTRLRGWVPTDRQVLDLLREETWLAHFSPSSVDAILAEHVWEHLPSEGAALAARICYRFLKPGGYLRIAVPDGMHPDPAYVASVRPGGSGDGADDHQALYTHVTIGRLFAEAGFDVQLKEYFDAAGQFHFTDWDPSGGMIDRSSRFDPRNSQGQLAYTSIVLDAVKPR